MQKGIVILKDERGGIFRILCEKGQNLQAKKKKSKCDFCVEHTAVIPILVIMILFRFFSDTIM